MFRNEQIHLLRKIPDTYLGAEGTYMGTIKGCVDFFTHLTNLKSRNILLDELQLSEKILNTTSIMLNINTLLEVERVFDQFNLSKTDMANLAFYLNRTNPKRMNVINSVKDFKTDFATVAHMCDIANKHYDKNFTYSIKLDGDRFLVEGIGNEQVHDELKSNVLTGDMLAVFRANTIADVTTDIIGRPMKLVDVINDCSRSRQIVQYVFKESRPLLQ